MSDDPKWGDRVRVACTATGRYLCDGWAMFVSASDNDVCVDRVVKGVPHPTLPVPNDDEMRGALAMYVARNKVTNP